MSRWDFIDEEEIWTALNVAFLSQHGDYYAWLRLQAYMRWISDNRTKAMVFDTLKNCAFRRTP